jgi:hypothetical protein
MIDMALLSSLRCWYFCEGMSSRKTARHRELELRYKLPKYLNDTVSVNPIGGSKASANTGS